MQVIVFGDTSSTNLGDPILTYSAEYIVKQCFDENKLITVKTFDIINRKTNNSQKNVLVSKRNLLINSKLRSFITILKWYLKDKKIFEKRVLGAISNFEVNVFVIAGGALISSSLPYSMRLEKIVSFACERNIPVIFNAVGVEKSIKKGLGKFYIRKALKSPTVKCFATRDNLEGVAFLTKRKEFLRKNCDPGLFASETYNVYKKESKTVGIGIISLEAYKSVIHENKKAANITEESLIAFWNSIIIELEKNNIDWNLFTNGGEKDYNLAYKLIDKYNYSKEKLLPRPKQPEELIEQISNFHVVMAHRLHALIIATSLQIPIIPIVWSNKVLEFAKELEIPELSFWPEMENVPCIAQKLLDENFTANDKKILELKKQAINFLKNEFSNLVIK